MPHWFGYITQVIHIDPGFCNKSVFRADLLYIISRTPAHPYIVNKDFLSGQCYSRVDIYSVFFKCVFFIILFHYNHSRVTIYRTWSTRIQVSVLFSDSETLLRIAALITCHNRREQTLDCLSTLERCFNNAHIAPSGFLFDDGSSDGTDSAVSKHYPWMKTIRGNGDAFWSRGMHRAWLEALKEDFDAYLWLNDDVTLYEDALIRTVQQFDQARATYNSPAIYIGSMRWPHSERVAYGGLYRPSQLIQTRFRLIDPATEPKECDSMNGNYVLVPREAVQRVGILDPIYEHGLGDFDYGLRAHKAGVRLLLMPGFFGECSRNPLKGTFHDRKLTRFTRLHRLLDRRFLPPQSWFVFCYRHGGFLWPVFFVWPYLRTIFGFKSRGL